MRYRILGPLAITGGSEQVRLTAPKHRALLLYLLLNRNKTVSVDRLLDALWPEGPPSRALKTLQLYVSQVRKALGNGDLETRPAGYALVVGDDQLDAAVFERMLGEGRNAVATGNEHLGSALLTRALTLWRGEALVDVAYADFATAEMWRLEELRIACIEERIEADLSLGRHDRVREELVSLVERHPLRERLRGLLMVALYRSGRQAEALSEYRAARLLLRDELGLEPAPTLTELHQAILRHDEQLAAPPSSVESPRPLPSPATPLIGREAELQTLRRWLDDPDLRQITLTGAGGSGKTRLALSLAHARQSDFANGAVFVELATVRNPARVVAAIAEACTARSDIASRAELVEWLSERELLLVVDNFEHLLEASTELAYLVAACPLLKLVVTSRSVLHLSGEHVFPVEPLAEDDAIALFIARVRAVEPRAALAADGTAVLREICNRLDCLPLALELAGAQGHALTANQLLDRLRQRVMTVGGSLRDLPARQQTLQDTLTWSTDLLDDKTRRALGALGVFAGGFTLESAQSVASASVDQITTLLDHSLLVRTEAKGDGRFTMLETVREHALQLLGGERVSVEERHALYFLSVAEDASARFASPEQTAVTALLDAEQANLDAALDVFRQTGKGEHELRLSTALWSYWRVRGHTSIGRANLERALRQPNLDDQRRLPALHGAAVLADSQGDYESSTAFARESLCLSRALGSPAFEAKAYTILSSAAIENGDFDEAAVAALRAIELQTDTRDRAFSLLNLGNVELNRRRFSECVQYSRQSVDLFRTLGDPLQAATPLFNIGLATLEQGDHDVAESHLLESFSLICQLGHVEFIANGLDALAAIDAIRGSQTRAILELSSAAALRDKAAVEAQRFEATLHERTAAALRAHLGDERFDELVAEAADDPWGVVAETLSRPA